MSIRTANNLDVPQIIELVSSLAHYYLDDSAKSLPLWFADTLTDEAFSERVFDATFLNLIFEESGNVLGYLSLKDSSHLYHLFVATSAQRRGVAGNLWRRARELSGSRIYTVRSSLFAVPVYRKFGFIESGPVGSREGISFQPMELRE